MSAQDTPLQSCPCAQGLHSCQCETSAVIHCKSLIACDPSVMSSVTPQGSGVTPRHPPRAETAGRQLRASQVLLSLTGIHPCTHPVLIPIPTPAPIPSPCPSPHPFPHPFPHPPLPPQGTSALTSGFSWPCPWSPRPAACAWPLGPSRCPRQPFPLHTQTRPAQELLLASAARRNPPGERGRAAKPKPAPGLRCFWPQLM